MSDLNTEIKIGADASGVEAGVGKAKRSLKDLGDAAQKAGKDAGAGIGSIGAGGDKAAKDVERATKNMQGSLQRLLAEQKAGAKGSREYYEALADTRGISRNAIKPILDQIDAAKSKTLQAKTAADSWTASLGKVGPLVAAAFSGAAITGFLGKVVSVQREFDVLNSSLKTVTGSSAAAEREMAWLKDFAKETPFGLAQATQGFVKMKALGLDPTRAALTSFGNTASAMGKDLNQMIEAVADASTGEFERLKEFGIKAKKEGDNVSLTFQGVTTTIGNSAREITQYLEDIGNTSFGGAMEDRAKTLDGTIAALGDTWDELFRTVSSNNVGSLIFDSVTLANGALEDATTILRALGGAAQDAGRDTGALSTIQSGIATVFETVAVLGANLKFVLVGIGNEIGGLAAQVAQAAQFNFSGVAAIRRQMVADAEAARKEIDATTARILNARKAQEEYARYATRNASAATDPRRIDLGGTTTRTTSGGVSSGTAKAVKEAISEYDKLIKKLSDELPRAAAEAEAAQMGYNKAQTEFLALAGSPAWASFSDSQRAVVASMFEGKIASEEAGEAAKALSKAYAEAAAERLKTIQSMERAADSLQSQNDALREEIELIGLSTEQQTLVLQQRNDVIILTKEATLAELERQSAITGTQTRVEIALASEIDALKERNALLGAKGVKNAAVDAAKSAADEWQKTSDKINDTLTDAIMRGFESGKDFAKNLRDTVINMFKTMVLRPVISAIVNPVAGAVTSALGLSGTQGSGNSIMGGIQTASNLNTLYGAGSQALFGGAAGASAASLGYANIVGMAGGDAIGALATANGMWAGVATGAQAAAQSAIAANAAMAAGEGVALAAGTNAAAAGAGAGAGGASSALAAIPGWGWALAGVAALAALWDDGSGTLHTGAKAQYSAADGLATTGEGGKKEYGLNVGMVYDKNTAGFVGGVAKGLTETFDGLAVAFGQKAGYQVATAFADDTSKDGAWGALRISKDGKDLLNWEDTRTSRWAPKEFANGEAGQKEYLAAIAKDTRTVLLDMDLPSWADTMLESIGDAANMEQISSTVQQIAAIKTQFVQLGKAMEMFDGISSGMESALLSAAGSIDALTASAAGYYDAVYTEQEKIARARTQLETTLAGYGQSLPATREQYRALVEQQMAAGESGAEFAVVLMGLAGTFAQVADDIDAQFAEMGKSAAEVFEKLLADIGRVRGDVAGTRADMLASAQVMTPAQIAAAVNAAMVYAPTTAGIVGAQGGVASAAEQVAVRKAAADAAQATANGLYGSLQNSVSARDATASEQSRLTAAYESARLNYAKFQDGGEYRNYSYRNRVRNMGIFAAEMQSAMQQLDALRPSLDAYNAAISAQQPVYEASIGAANAYAQQLAAAQAALVTAQQAEVQARVDYAAQISQFVTAAGGSVSKLSGLREEVVRYYEAQEQAVQSMIATAENLRNVVGSIRMGQLDSAQTASQLGNSYAMDYSMALATTGSTRAGYADSMASALPTLAEAIKAEASTASDWRVQTGKLLAQATGVAGMLEADASGADYQTTSLGLLDSIDTALAQLEGSTKSAEQVIAQAINDGTASQLTGLRAIVAALRGESVPAFATGGSFGGGLRLVGENGPELEVTGPSRIYSASQTAAMLSGGGNANAELVKELRALRADNQAQAAAMVNMQRELNKLMLRWDSQGMPEERIV